MYKKLLPVLGLSLLISNLSHANPIKGLIGGTAAGAAIGGIAGGGKGAGIGAAVGGVFGTIVGAAAEEKKHRAQTRTYQTTTIEQPVVIHEYTTTEPVIVHKPVVVREPIVVHECRHSTRSLMAENTNLKLENNSLINTIHEQDKEISYLRQEKQALTTRTKQLENTQASLVDELNESNKKLDRTTRNLEIAEEDIAKLQQENKKLHQTIDKLEQKLSEERTNNRAK